jgi:hypothetical protein
MILMNLTYPNKRQEKKQYNWDFCFQVSDF